MSTSDDNVRQLLQESGLRVTQPRLAVLRLLRETMKPMSHTEVLEQLGPTTWDQATIYRNLKKLTETGLALVASRVDGIDRYVFRSKTTDLHRHPHFVCDDCGQVACLPASFTPTVAGNDPWAASIERAVIQLRGECPDCLALPPE